MALESADDPTNTARRDVLALLVVVFFRRLVCGFEICLNLEYLIRVCLENPIVWLSRKVSSARDVVGDTAIEDRQIDSVNVLYVSLSRHQHLDTRIPLIL